MNAKKAYSIIKKANPGCRVIDCLEFVDFFAFSLAPNNYNPDVDGGIGGGYDTVNKESGKISTFNPVEDLTAFRNAKVVNIKELN